MKAKIKKFGLLQKTKDFVHFRDPSKQNILRFQAEKTFPISFVENITAAFAKGTLNVTMICRFKKTEKKKLQESKKAESQFIFIKHLYDSIAICTFIVIRISF